METQAKGERNHPEHGDVEVPDVQPGDSGDSGGESGLLQPSGRAQGHQQVSPGDFGLSYGDILLIKARQPGWDKQIAAVRRQVGNLIDHTTAERWCREAVRAEKDA